jgi:hypothetical protein
MDSSGCGLSCGQAKKKAVMRLQTSKTGREVLVRIWWHYWNINNYNKQHIKLNIVSDLIDEIITT